MEKKINSQDYKKIDTFVTQVFSSFCVLQGFYTFFILASVPSEVEARILWLYSIPRIVELIIIAIIIIICANFCIKSFTSPVKGDKFRELVSTSAWKEILVFGGILISIFSRASIVILQALAQNPAFNFLAGFANHLIPISSLISLLGIEISLWVFFVNRDNLLRLIKNEKAYIKVLVIVWGLLGALILLSIFLRENFQGIIMGRLGGPPVPLLEWQILLAWIISTIVMLYGRQHKISLRHLDYWIVGAIWAVASFLWISQPVNPGFAARPPMAPNFEIYPFSDAQLYAQNSQSIIVGKGMAGEEFPSRPIYVIFLAIAHAVMGQDYSQVIALQSLFLAAFPAILYLLGKEISGRPLGVALAILSIVRDITTNAVASFTVSVAYSKLFMSELPVAMLLSLFTLLSIKWIRDSHGNKSIPIIAGGVLGIATLARTQSIIALFPVIFIALISKRGIWKIQLLQFFLVLLGVSLSLFPWLYRNWQHTGGIVVDNPRSQMSVFAVRYSEYNKHITIPHLPGENDSEYSNRMLQIALESIYANPQKIAISISNHFFQNETGNLLAFPIRNNLPTAKDLFTPTTNFWESWDTASTFTKTSLVFFYLLLFSIGITTAWKKLKWLGLLPLGINISYNAWTALFLASGIRFIFPVDWAFYLYEMLGLISITLFIFSILGTLSNKPQEKEYALSNTPPFPSWIYALSILLIFLAGISLPLSEIIVPDQYPEKTQTQMWDDFSKQATRHNSNKLNYGQINDLIIKKNLTIFEGRAIYPRYFSAGKGFPLTEKPGYEVSEQDRLVFELVGQRTGRVIFPLAEYPRYFPNAADVTIIIDNDSIDNIWLILVSKNGQEAIYTSALLQNALGGD